MYYKTITLENRKGELVFIEEDLNFEREDEGEYIWINKAFIYKSSDVRVWKSKMKEDFKQQTVKQLEFYNQILKDVEKLK